MNWACTNFVVIFAAALVMWIFRLLPEYVPAVFMILATIILGLAHQNVLLSGFGSDSFFLSMPDLDLPSIEKLRLKKVNFQS
ncbi:hypothetical protein Lbru_1278 [Legionella brunensis]|uniref:Uncharacterized protein n=2 Tax=Legionella brunensis TaxID=29422 RepID=A0A0W0SNS7_9GAMM|nr:hypothetical protein Lbru_1278 [Legionella brunensis]